MLLFATGAMLAALVLGYFLWNCSNEVTRLKTRFAGIIDAAAAVDAARQELENTRQAQIEQTAAFEKGRLQFERDSQSRLDAQVHAGRQQLEHLEQARQDLEGVDQKQRAEISREYEQALTTYNDLKREVSLLEEQATFRSDYINHISIFKRPKTTKPRLQTFVTVSACLLEPTRRPFAQ